MKGGLGSCRDRPVAREGGEPMGDEEAGDAPKLLTGGRETSKGSTMTKESAIRPDVTGSPGAPTCAFCLSPAGRAGRPTPDPSVLLSGRHHYVMAPLGQLMEGFLLIMPHTCVTGDGRRRRCVSQLVDDELGELRQLTDLVSEFYESAYGLTEVTFYEQGRAGGGLESDLSGRFYHHAHVCCVPARVELRPEQEAIHERIDVAGIAGIAEASAGRPYLYLELRREGRCDASVFVGRDDEGTRALENSRLRTRVAAYLGTPQRGNWRQEDDLAERDAVVRAFTRFRTEHRGLDGGFSQVLGEAGVVVVADQL
jgi:hypothetical protein